MITRTVKTKYVSIDKTSKVTEARGLQNSVEKSVFL